MIKTSAISPKTIISMGGMEGASTPEELQLKELLQQMSYGMLQSKAPNLMPYVTSFKPIEFDIESNRAVGAFSLDLNGVKIMVPIVMSEGKIKPPEVFYSEDIDTYLPLTDAWVQEAQRRSIGDMGSATKAPPGLSSDVDIRALTLPPTTGRFVYASYASRKPNLIKAVADADNNVKLAFSRYIANNKTVLKALVKYNGASCIDLLRPTAQVTKVASKSTGPGWLVLTPRSSKQEFVSAFGNKYASAFSSACQKGVLVREFRKEAGIAVDNEVPLSETMMSQSGITEPNFPDVYNIADTAGKTHKALVIPRPFYVSGTDSTFTFDSGRVTRPTNPEDSGHSTPRYIVITPDKKVGIFDKLIGITTTESIADSQLIADASTYREPKNGDKLFLAMKGGEITNAAYLPDGITNVMALGEDDFTANYGKTKVIFTSSRAVKVPKYIKHSESSGPGGAQDTIVIPSWYSPISTQGSELVQSDYIVDPTVLNNYIMGRVVKLSHDTLVVKRASDDSWYLNGKYCEGLPELLTKAASLGANVEILHGSVTSISPNSRRSYHLVSPRNIVKLSSIFGPSQPQGMPPDQMGGMPQQGMPPDQIGGMPQQGMPPDQMGGMQQQVGQAGDQAMQGAANVADEELFNASAIATLIGLNPLNEAVAEELPSVEKALDSVARILLTVQVREADLTQQLGGKEYSDLEANLKRVLIGIGSILLTINKQKNMTSLPEGLGMQ